MSSQSTEARRVLAALTARYVSSADVERTPIETGSVHREDLLAQARRDRVVPILGKAIDDELIEVDDKQREAVANAWNAVMRRCLKLDERLLWLRDELARRGVDLRVLKGPASAHLDHRSPALRQYGDLDVLVRGDDLRAVFETLTAHGMVRSFATPSIEFDRRFIKSASFRGDVEIDVHRTIADSPLGHRIPTDELWATGAQFKIGGVTLEGLPAPLRLLHACLHAHLGPPPTPLSSHSDVAALLDTVQPDTALATADRWRIDAVVAAAIDGTISELWWPSAIDSGWRTRASVGPMLDGLLVAAHRSPTSSSTIRTLLAPLTLPTWRDRLVFLRELVLPGPAYASGRTSRARQLVHSIGTAVRRTGP